MPNQYRRNTDEPYAMHRMNRRELLRQGVLLVTALPVLGSVVAACGSTEDSSTGVPVDSTKPDTTTLAFPTATELVATTNPTPEITPQTTRSTQLKTFVLVHGAWSNADVWSEVAQRLEAAGNKVFAPNLPSHGVDETPPEKATLDGYAETVIAIAQSADQPVVLVGHSMAGTVISTVAERNPELVAHLVYLAAFLLPNGQSLYGFTQTSPGMADSALGPALRPGEDTLGVDPAAFIDVFCADAPADAAKAAAAALRPDPLAPLGTPITITDDRWGSVPRSYIFTSKDRCVSPASQKGSG
jgi:pimeloyl-ACP methyl ester carboxylesterase